MALENRSSLLVDSEYNASAEERVVFVGEARVVVVGVIPEALGGHSHTLPRHLAYHTLHNDLVLGDVAVVFDLGPDGVHDLLGPVLCVGVLVLFVCQHALNHRLNNHLDLGRVESKVYS